MKFLKSYDKHAVILSIVSALLIISFGTTLFDPKLIYTYIHYGWLIFVTVVYMVYSVIIIIYGFEDLKPRIIKIVNAATTLLVIIISFTAINNSHIKISKKSDFNILGNMPFSDTCHYELTNDIDFNGGNFNGFGAIATFKGSFDGNYHTLKNVKHVRKVDQFGTPNEVGFVRKNKGTIKNIRFVNCLFSIYYEETESNFGIIASNNEGTIENCILEYCNIRSTIGTYYHSPPKIKMGMVVANDKGTIKNVLIDNVLELPDDGFDINKSTYKVTNTAGISNGIDCLVIADNISLNWNTNRTYKWNLNEADKFLVDNMDIISYDFYKHKWGINKNGMLVPCYGFDDITSLTLDTPKLLSKAPDDSIKFNGHYYKIIYCNGGITWREARLDAIFKGGKLVSITSKEEQEFVHSLMKEYDHSWIGSTDCVKSNVWTWEDESPFDYNNWGPNQPSGDNGKVLGREYEHYVEMRPNGQWNDRSSSSKNNYYIIEWQFD